MKSFLFPSLPLPIRGVHRLLILVALVYIGVGDCWSAVQSLSCSTYLQQCRRQRTVSSTCLFSSASGTTRSSAGAGRGRGHYKHTLAILTMPSTSTEKIANEAILNQAVEHTNKLSVVLRADGKNPSLARLRQYVGEVYSTLWDVAMNEDYKDDGFCDVVVYPQNLPNAAPEQWINHAPDLDSVCSHDSICGWVSESALGRGLEYQSRLGQGVGGLDAHVTALNADRAQRSLRPVQAIHVEPWPMGASAALQHENNVAFLDDDPDGIAREDGGGLNGDRDFEDSSELIGGVKVPAGCLFDQVAVGGTFDGMHYGHRKLLTLAVSSVNPASGKLMVGVTVDDMLKKKSFAEQIPKLDERMDGVRDFIYRLAPGIKNRVRISAIADEYGPPGTVEDGKDFDALVLSHETLENGVRLNKHRVGTLGLPPLALLCTRRTEPHGMSSTALRRRKWEQHQRKSRTELAN